MRIVVLDGDGMLGNPVAGTLVGSHEGVATIRPDIGAALIGARDSTACRSDV
jgi:hypothetical protein